MKKFKNILFLSLLVVLMGCNDAIEITQDGRLDADAAFQTVGDLESGLFGLYAGLDTTPEIAFSSNFTDELSIGFDSGGQGLALYGFVLNAGSVVSTNFWTRNYAVIRNANILLDAADIVTPEPGEEALYNEVIGEALAIRAFAHLELVTYYSTDLTDDNALGVITLDYVPSIDQQLLRNTNAETFALINDDLNRASSLITTQSHPTFISKDFVTAMKARIAAYRGDYGTAGPLAQSLLNNYPIATRAQYQNMFFDGDNTEIIFKLERTVSDGYDGQGTTGSVNAGGWAGARFAFVDATLTGSPYFEMGRTLFNALDPGDIRYDVIVAPTSVIDPDYPNGANLPADDILVIQKYFGSEGKPLMNDLKVFRASEMLLILAESRADANNLTGVATLIKQLRDARFGSAQPLPVYANQAEAFGAILDERFIELAYEGHRYKDLKRLGTMGNRGVDRDPLDCALNGACTLSASDFKFTLPLPIVEFNANPGLRDQQNPGY